MRKLILASSDNLIIPEKIDKYLPFSLTKSKILYITTALKKTSHPERIKEKKKRLKNYGLQFTEFDIAGKNIKEVDKAMSNADIIYVEGGNTFYLIKSINESRFKEVLDKYLSKGLVYIGISAGTYVACPSIIMATWSWKHNYDRCGLVDYRAMNLVPFLIKAHFVPEMKDFLIKKSQNSDYTLHVLDDEQAFVVEDKKIFLIGKSSKTIL